MSKQWDALRTRLDAMLAKPYEWDDGSADKLDSMVIEHSKAFADKLEAAGYNVASIIYPLYEGTIIFEWQTPEDIIIRIEVDQEGNLEQMVSYPNKPTEFSTISFEGISKYVPKSN